MCGNRGVAPKRYASVVVFAFENRTWSSVGLGFGPQMPYLHGLGRRCSYFTDWTETDTAQNSLTQYVGQVTGAYAYVLLAAVVVFFAWLFVGGQWTRAERNRLWVADVLVADALP